VQVLETAFMKNMILHSKCPIFLCKNSAVSPEKTTIRKIFTIMSQGKRIRSFSEVYAPANIGYGLTYVFPILVAGLLSKKGQVLIIDSPEAHLHPMGQSKIGYFLAVMAAAGVQVIVETHSDHVLNGVRLAVSKHSISNDDVAIHFFSPSQSASDPSSVVTSPLIDIQGNLSEWPEGFFDQSDKDLATLSGWD